MKILTTFLILIISTTFFAQVGINTENPNQALDINGKIKIGDDETTPTEGTVRYNATTREFQGYNGLDWVNLNNSTSTIKELVFTGTDLVAATDTNDFAIGLNGLMGLSNNVTNTTIYFDILFSLPVGSEILDITYIYADFIDGHTIKFMLNEFELIPDVSVSGGGASSSTQLNEFTSIEQDDVILSQTLGINHLVSANKIYYVGALFENAHLDVEERLIWKIIITYR